MFDRVKKKSIIRLFNFLKKRRIAFFIGLLGLSFVNITLNSISAIGLNGVTNGILEKNMNVLIKSIEFMAIALLLFIIIMPVFSYAFESSIKITTGRIRKALFEHIQRIPMKYFEDTHSGDFISRLSNDIQWAENAYGFQLLMLLMSLVSGIGSGIVIFFIDFRLALLSISIGLLNVYISVKFSEPIKEISSKIQQLLSTQSQSISENINGVQIIRAFSINSYLEKQFNDNCDEIRRWSMRRIVRLALLSGLSSFSGLMNFAGVVVVGSFMVIHNMITFGKLIAIILMINGLTWMFNSVGNFLGQLQGSIAAAERIFEILDIPVEVGKNNNVRFGIDATYNENVQTTEEEGVAVQFDNIHFSYDEKKEVLSGINLKLLKKQVIALVGPSGSGKSTIFKLLLSFYDWGQGDIYVFNRKISDYSLEELRNLISYVSQESYLYSGTVAENIGYGKKSATRDEIIKAAKEANAHEFILTLENGYDTEVGEKGENLSGGQRQRIAIARAILKNSPILLLDEATSSLDSESEKAVKDALDILMKDRSTMVIAHRLSTIQNADMILVLKEGKIVENGRHEELIKQNEVYAELYNYQFN